MVIQEDILLLISDLNLISGSDINLQQMILIYYQI